MKRLFITYLFAMIVMQGSMNAVEMRGIWVRPPESAEEINVIMDTLAYAGMNAVFVETYYHSYTIYPSVYADQRPEFRGRDVLQEFIDAARPHNIEVHAWVEVFYAGNPKHLGDEGPVLKNHPEWILPAVDGTAEFEDGKLFINPALPAVRSYLLNVFREIISKYDVHGLHLDYIRYPVDRDNRPPGYDDYSRTLYIRQHGIDPITIDRENDRDEWIQWTKWRKRQITTFVEDVQRMILIERPEVQLSAAVFSDKSTDPLGDEKCQDWDTWVARGLIDFLTPMCYAVSTERIMQMVRESIERGRGKVPVYIGLALNHHTDRKSFDILMTRTMQKEPEGIVIFAWNWRHPFTFDYLHTIFEAQK
jgi:uncharacterized lipoprotein YddW (UPF0748 family)